MSKRLLLSVICVSMVAGLGIGYLRALPNDFVDESQSGSNTVSDYGYRCGDGSEFTLVPSEDMQSVRIVPATSVDYVHEADLKKRTDATGMYYEGDGVALRPNVSGLILVSDDHPTTTCTSMQPATASLFNGS